MISETEAKYKEIIQKAKDSFKNSDYNSAIQFFTEAINLQPSNHLLYSNRSACYTEIGNYEKAIQDAIKCLEINPNFVRGFQRKALAEFKSKKFDDSIKSYESGLKLEPNNSQLLEELQEVKEMSQKYAFGTKEQIQEKINKDPILKSYLKYPDFVEKLEKVCENSQNLFEFMKTDPRFMGVLHTLSGIPLSEIVEATQSQKRKDEEILAAQRKIEEEKSKQIRQEAENMKNKGNEFYKNKKFDDAILYYEKAIEINQNEPIYYLNKAAVFLELKKFPDAINLCDQALKICENITPKPIEKIAKAYARKGNIYLQMQDFNHAIENYDKSLLEVNDASVKESKKNCLEQKKKYEEKAMYNPELSEKHKEDGNKAYRNGNYASALSEYNEAIKHNPQNAVLYLNRAMTYMKTIEYKNALEDLEKSIKLDPKYVKAYSKKGQIYHYLKEFHRALSAYEKGLEIDPNNEECKIGLQNTEETMYKTPPSEERAKKAMDDDEIRALMSDPRVKQMLKEMQEGQKEAKSLMMDPFYAKVVRKLIAAGILGMR